MSQNRTWKQGLLTAIKTLVWPNTLIALFVVYALVDVTSHGLTGSFVDEHKEFLFAVIIIVVLFNLVGVNRSDHLLLGATVSLCMLLGILYVIDLDVSSTTDLPLSRIPFVGRESDKKGQEYSSEGDAWGNKPMSAPRNGTRIMAFRGAKGQGTLRIINESGRDAAVKMLDNTPHGRMRLFVYIKAKSEAAVDGIGTGSYLIRVALGKNWDPQSLMFLSNQTYFQLTQSVEFSDKGPGGEIKNDPRMINLLLARKSTIAESVFRDPDWRRLK